MGLPADIDVLIAGIKAYAAAQVPAITNEQALKTAISKLSKRAAADPTFGLSELEILPAIFTRAQERYAQVHAAISTAHTTVAQTHAAEVASAINAINIPE